MRNEFEAHDILQRDRFVEHADFLQQLDLFLEARGGQLAGYSPLAGSPSTSL